MASAESQVPVLEIAHVLFMDIVSYSKLPMDEQQKVLRRLQHAVRDTAEFQRAQSADQLIRLPTGDGMALVFFGDPEAPARCAMELSGALRDIPEINLRMGIHTGPVYRLADINANRNVSGGGINLAQRVMDCGDAGHILVSSAVAEVLNEIGTWGNALHDIGEAEVKHGLRVHLYNLYTPAAGNADRPHRVSSPSKAPGFGPSPASSAALDAFIGQTVSHYRVLRRLDGGGMGIVYEAVDTRLGRHVALKFLSEHLLQDPLALERFRREATLASSLNHPNICTLYDIGEQDNRNFLVLELLDGDTLRARMERGRLALHDALQWAIQVADGLQLAHARGIVHRDIKPGNIFITDLGTPKILDFGLAKLTDTRGSSATAAPEAHLTVAGMPLGTVAYMSPEQARGEELDGRSDIFSFGAVLYEMVTGRLPFEGSTSAMVFDAILNRAPTAPISLNRELPAVLQSIINRAIEKDRERRYGSAAEIAADLRRLLRQIELSSTPEQRPATSSRLRQRALLVIGGLGASALLFTAIWLARSHRARAVAPPSPVQQAQQPVSAPPSAKPTPAQVAPPAATNPKTDDGKSKAGTRPDAAAAREVPAAVTTKTEPPPVVKSGLSGEYAGNLHVPGSNTDVPASVQMEEQAGIVTGCLGLSAPLRGAGPFRGVSQGELVLGTVYFSTGRTELQGQIIGNEFRGKYLITDGGKRREGTFSLQRKSSSAQLAGFMASACRMD